MAVVTKLKVFESFSGIGAQRMALKRLPKEHEVVGISEIDKYAIQAYNAVHGDTPNFGDISKINWYEVPDFDLFTYSFPCFLSGTLILTEVGYKNIENISASDKVLTHTNSFNRVIMPMRKLYQGDIYNINAMCFDRLECTPEHPFYVREKYYKWEYKGALTKEGWKKNSRIRCFSKPKWVDAKDLTKNHYLGYAINKKSELPKWNGVINNTWGHSKQENKLSTLFENKSFWYLMGRYVADGWKKKSKTGDGIIICCGGRNEDKLIQTISNIGYKATVNKDRTATKYIISSNELNAFVGRYGYYAHGKLIDAETLNLPIDLLKSFIDGYVDGDGCRSQSRYRVTSVSRELIYGVQQCISKVYKCPVQMYHTQRHPTCIIEGRLVNQRDTYQITWKTTPAKQDKAFYEDGYIWFPINNINISTKEIMVYNMEVDKDNSYTANGCIVHNCQSISSAGLQRGFEEGSGTTSSLLWECKRAIEAKKPKYMLMENVSALTQAKFMPTFRKWQDYLASLGYSNFAQILNSKDYGVPQNRERVFMVSILGNEWYNFPQPIKQSKCLGDVLESQVDEKYYLSQKMVDCFMARVNIAKGYEFKIKQNKDIANTIVCKAGNYSTDNYVKQNINLVEKRNFANPQGAGAKILGYTRDNKGKVQSYHEKDLANTIHTSTGSGGNTDQFVINNAYIRKLTPKECFRLMGVCEEDINKIQSAGISNSQQYRQAGNSIVVDVLEAIFRNLLIPQPRQTLFG